MENQELTDEEYDRLIERAVEQLKNGVVPETASIDPADYGAE